MGKSHPFHFVSNFLLLLQGHIVDVSHPFLVHVTVTLASSSRRVTCAACSSAFPLASAAGYVDAAGEGGKHSNCTFIFARGQYQRWVCLWRCEMGSVRHWTLPADLWLSYLLWTSLLWL